jgi:hypothetical protein
MDKEQKKQYINQNNPNLAQYGLKIIDTKKSILKFGLPIIMAVLMFSFLLILIYNGKFQSIVTTGNVTSTCEPQLNCPESSCPVQICETNCPDIECPDFPTEINLIIGKNLSV